MPIKQSSFCKELLIWHRSIDRQLPWKTDNDPYRIWVSEIIMQQTRIDQGTPYYLRFIEQFPSIDKLAAARLEKVLKAWEGLGYYSRARNMHHTAIDIMSRFNGVFPTEYNDVLSLKGIGPYTAAAIVSFAYGLPHAVVDGNVNRVISRYFGITEPIDSTKGMKRIWRLTNENLPESTPGDYNQAIMDFGALMCKAKLPKCLDCPIQNECYAFQNDLVSTLPIKSKKTKVRDRYFHYFFYNQNDKILISQREDRDIWAKLFELPLIETDANAKTSIQAGRAIGIQLTDLERLQYIKHRLSHQLLHISIYLLDYLPQTAPFESGRLENVEELHRFAFPKPLNRFISESIIY